MKPMLVVCLAVFFCAALSAGEPEVTTAERAKAIKFLEDSRDQLLQATEKLSEAQWTYKPAPERWSVAEVAEHILLSEGLLFSRVEKALAEKANPEWEAKTAGKDELLERVLPDRSRKAQAPEALQPSSKLSRSEILGRFKEARARTLKFIKETDRPLKAHTLDHAIPIFSTLNAYQWLIYIPLHNIRHNQQIAEVKADPGFPK